MFGKIISQPRAFTLVCILCDAGVVGNVYRGGRDVHDLNHTSRCAAERGTGGVARRPYQRDGLGGFIGFCNLFSVVCSTFHVKKRAVFDHFFDFLRFDFFGHQSLPTKRLP